MRIEACASMKSFQRKEGSGDDGDGEHFHGQKRGNETHVSSTDPDALPCRKGPGKEATLRYLGPILTENRNDQMVGASVSEAKRSHEWPEAVERLAQQPVRPGQTVGADKGYEVSHFVDPCREPGFMHRLPSASTVASMGARPSMRATRSVRTNESGSSRRLAGGRPSGGYTNFATAAGTM